MSTRYPATGIDDSTTLPNPATTDKRNSPSLAGQQANQNDAIKAVETKLGTGSSTAASNTLLFGTGAGTSAWQGLTSAQLAAVLSDETGTGSAVFATTPTLVTPKVDTINEATLGNGVTVGGVNLKSGVVSTAGAVGTTALASASVTPTKLATGAVAAYVATSETTASTSYTDLTTTSDTITVTIGANGLALVVIDSNAGNNTNGAYVYMSFVVSGTSTVASGTYWVGAQEPGGSASSFYPLCGVFLVTGLTAGSCTFKAKYKVSAGTGSFLERRIAVVPL